MEHLTDRQIVAVLSRSPEAWTAARHLEECAACRERAAGLLDLPGRIEGLLAGFGAAEPVEHLTYETLERLVDGVADAVETEVAAAHLSGCAACRREHDDLRAFAGRPEHVLRPAPRRLRRWALAAVVVLAAGAIVASRWWQGGSPEPVAVEEVARAPEAAAPPPAEASVPTRPGPAVVARVQDRNGPIVLLADGRVDGLPSPFVDDALRRALETREIVAPEWLADLAAAPEVLRSGTERETLVALVGPLGRVVASATPTLRWTGPEGGYDVEVYDEDLRLVATGAAGDGSWVVSPPLPRGRTYSWQLRRRGPEGEQVHPHPPAPPARFRVLGADAVAELDAARASGSHLAAAVAAARHGLVDEATRELAALAALSPDGVPPVRLREP